MPPERLAGAATAALGGPVALQVIVAAVVSLAMLGLVRPIALNHLRQPAEIRTGVDALLGSEAVVDRGRGPRRRSDQARRRDLDGPAVRPAPT